MGGVKRWPYDLTDGVVAHGENVTFFCKHPEKLCSFTATEVCVDGELKAPGCYLGMQSTQCYTLHIITVLLVLLKKLITYHHVFYYYF